MSKIKVLVLPSDKSGCSKFRSIDPHVMLQNLYPDYFHVDIDYEPRINDVNYWKQYHIVHAHRNIGTTYENTPNLIKQLKSLGIVVIIDIDDYWLPTKEHPIHHLIVQHKLHERIIANLKEASYVTTTTKLFADEIRKINKNVIIVPNAINPKEAQFNEPTLKSDKVRVGWLGGSCYDDTTEILTENGFKLFKDLDKNEKVATLNPDTNEIEYHNPTNYISEPFKGDLNCVNTGLIEYSVTPNHKMYVSPVKHLGHKKNNFNLIPSENIHGNHFHVKRDGIWNGEDKEYFTLPSYQNTHTLDMQPIINLFNDDNVLEENDLLLEYEGSIGVGTYQNKEQVVRLRKSTKNNYYLTTENYLTEKYGSEKQIKMDDWLKFFGFWLAEGWVSKTDGLHQVGVAQVKNNGYLEEMFVTLQNMGFNPTYTKDGNQVRVFDKQLWQYLSQFGDAITKYIPKDIMNLSSRQLNILLDWFIKGDGNTEKKYGRHRAWTSSKVLSDNLQEIALKTGIAATIKNRGKRTSQIKGREITNQHDSYQLGFSKHPSVSKHNKLTPLVRSEEQYTRPYDGMVYCVEVKNHILYVRKNGKPFWCGNSHLHDLMLLDGFIDKNSDISDKLQYVLCGFDTRGSVTEVNQQTGEQKQRPILPHETVWARYEEIFTSNYKIIGNDYRSYLNEFKEYEYKTDKELPYVRVWTKPVTSYAMNYSKFDISLAPIKNHIFNRVKSQLKVIEAGFYKKAIIASNIGPYTLDLKHCLKNGNFVDGNAMLVDENKNHSDWSKFIKKLVQNPNLIEDMGHRLYETVKDEYDLNNVAKNISQFYKSIV